ncbi:general secretion pathway protein A [Desulfosarcina sp. BuS5]|uniref:AAA family ATPase n=1 Tax=Desulfosarcina sp. BuS5 TaxID=933262 RepID=UPI000484D1E7|nr:AAA family ATPase [Desulfosarcina sp. BuS5]WDN90482.1 general secretion pathway protein A [Desulfosarcina sp. BuS5]
MYLSYYNLNVKPFQISPDPAFLWLGETHKEALAILKYGLLDNSGFLLLVGDVGTGKTTLINGFLETLDKSTIVAKITDPGLDVLDFYNFLATNFKMSKSFTTKGDFLVHFIHFLHKANKADKKVLLIIDEAQRLSHEMLEEIRLLSNIEKQDKKLLNIFLVGQNELNKILAETRNRALLQRITTRYDIGPLKKNDIKDYIQFRLSVAGTEKVLFNSGAIREIISFSECYPRRINVICNRALLTGFVKEKGTIDAAIIKESAKDLTLSKVSSKKENDHGAAGTGRKFARLVPIYATLLILLLIAGGYNYFFDKDERKPLYSAKSKANIVNADDRMNDKENPAPSVSDAEDTPAEIVPTESDMGESAFSSDTLNKNKEDDPPGLAKTLPEPYQDDKLTINISQNSDELVPESYTMIDRFIQRILLYPDAEVIIKGYTDSSGNKAYNKLLARFRANNVKSYLIGQGIDPLKIDTIGMGPENPVASNATPGGRAKNRRIEIELHH